jgi:hypothetical protein
MAFPKKLKMIIPNVIKVTNEEAAERQASLNLRPVITHEEWRKRMDELHQGQPKRIKPDASWYNKHDNYKNDD